MSKEDILNANRVIVGLLKQQGIDPTPAAIVEVLNHSNMTPTIKLAIAIAAA